MMKIRGLLDPGHYGSNVNHSPVVPDYYESNMTWVLAHELKAALERYGFEINLTRKTKDKNPSLSKRGKKSKGYDFFISLHSDAATTESPDHVSVFYPLDGRNNSETLAANLAAAIAEVMGVSKGKVKTKAEKNDPATEYYGVMEGAQKANCPHYYIVEHSFHTNKKAATWLLDPANLQRLAEVEAAIIAAFFDMDDPINCDMDGDGKLTATDAEIVRLAVMGRITLCEELEEMADVNGDGKVNAADYMRIKSAVLKK